MTKLYEANNHILIHTGYADPIKHCHKAAHIIISPEGNLRVMAEGYEKQCRGVMIPSGMSHMVKTCGGSVLVFLYDCTTDAARQIREIQDIPEECCERIADGYEVFKQEETADNYYRFESFMLMQLGIRASNTSVIEERIRSAIQYIRFMSSAELTCKKAADAAGLSQGRFSHLFKKQVGMSFASYLIYQRIMHVYEAMFRGKSITEAALEAGFSSSSHFADVNRRVFGISAGKIIRDLTFVKLQ